MFISFMKMGWDRGYIFSGALHIDFNNMLLYTFLIIIIIFATPCFGTECITRY